MCINEMRNREKEKHYDGKTQNNPYYHSFVMWKVMNV